MVLKGFGRLKSVGTKQLFGFPGRSRDIHHINEFKIGLTLPIIFVTLGLPTMKGYPMTDYDDFDADFDYPDNWLDEPEDLWDDVEADADTFASAGWGTDEDYGYYGAEDAALEYAWGDC